MNDEFRDTLQQILDLSDEQKIAKGKRYFNRFMEGLFEGGIPKSEAYNLTQAFTKFFVSADGKCSEAEYRFFTEVTGIKLSRDEFYEFSNGGLDKEFQEGIYDFARKLNSKDCVSLALFGALFMSADNKLTHEEINMLERILTHK